jgi:hypothetical protein
VSTHTAFEQAVSQDRALSTWRARCIAALGPAAAFAGVVWAIVQPYRVTLLHPRGESFWWLAVQPPLLVVLAGALFHVLVARPLLADLEELDDAASR